MSNNQAQEKTPAKFWWINLILFVFLIYLAIGNKMQCEHMYNYFFMVILIPIASAWWVESDKKKAAKKEAKHARKYEVPLTRENLGEALKEHLKEK